MSPATIPDVGCQPVRDPSTRSQPRAQALDGETHRMSRYKDLALRLAVVAAFVLVLAAPLRW